MIIASYSYNTKEYKKEDFNTYTGTTTIYDQKLKKLKNFVYEKGKLRLVIATHYQGRSMVVPSPIDDNNTNWCLVYPPLCDYSGGGGSAPNSPTMLMINPDIGGGGGGGGGTYVPSYNDYAVPPFTWNFNGDDGTTFTDPDPLIEPDFQFDPADNYETTYPRFTNMVKNLKTFVKNNPKVLNALQAYSGFSKQIILNHLTFGQGPTIKVEEMSGRFGFYNKNNGNKTLHIRASYVRGLEQAYLQSTQEGTAFLLAVTILHEYVHLGTTQNNISEGVYDFGYGFERDAFNVIVDDDNAGTVVIKFSKYF